MSDGDPHEALLAVPELRRNSSSVSRKARHGQDATQLFDLYRCSMHMSPMLLMH